MKKLLLGIIIGAAAAYFLDPQKGAERRARFTGVWDARKGTVLDVARTAGSVAGNVGHGVTELVAERIPTGSHNGAPAIPSGSRSATDKPGSIES